jgi:hypothetical protein
MLDDLRINPFVSPTRNSKLGTRNRAFPSFTSSELPALKFIPQNPQTFHHFSLKFISKTEPFPIQEHPKISAYVTRILMPQPPQLETQNKKPETE